MFPERLWLKWNITPVDETEMRPIAEVLLFPAHKAHGYFKIQNKGRHPARQTRCESGKKEQGSHTFWEPNNLLFIKTNECNKLNEN